MENIYKNGEGYTDKTAGDAIKKVQRTMIPRDSWAITERIIRRYPEEKEWYYNRLEEIYAGSPTPDGQPRGTNVGNPTEAKVLKALSDPKLQRVEREMKAIEKVFFRMWPEHQKVIRVRFWSKRYKNIPYQYMEKATTYREAQLKRIAGKFIKAVAQELGET